MKNFNDKAERIIMNNGNVMKVKYKSELLEQIRQDFEIMENESSESELLEQIRQDFEIMENESSDIDPGFFTEDDVWSLY